MKDTKYSSVIIKIIFGSTLCLRAHKVKDLKIFIPEKVVAYPIIIYQNETYNYFAEMFSDNISLII